MRQSSFQEAVDFFDFLGHGIARVKVVVSRLAVCSDDGHMRNATHTKVGIEDVFFGEGNGPRCPWL